MIKRLLGIIDDEPMIHLEYSLEYISRDLPFDFIIGAPARHIVNDTPIGTAISALLAIDTASIRAPKAPKHANPLKMHHSGTFSTHLVKSAR